MRLDYYPEAGSLYINLSEKPGASVVGIAEHVIVDADESGIPVGIDIDENTSKIGDLSRLKLSGVPLGDLAFSSEPKTRQAAS